MYVESMFVCLFAYFVESMFKEIGIFYFMEGMDWLEREKKEFAELTKILYFKKDMGYVEMYICP